MAGTSKSDAWDGAREFQSEKGETPDSSKEFARAEHEARNDAVGTEDEVREAKTPTRSSSLNSPENQESESSKSDKDNSES
jgi:hypothetical protein